MPTDHYVSLADILELNSRIFRTYESIDSRMLKRDIADLIDDKVITKRKREYKGNIEILSGYMAKTTAS